MKNIETENLTKKYKRYKKQEDLEAAICRSYGVINGKVDVPVQVSTCRKFRQVRTEGNRKVSR